MLQSHDPGPYGKLNFIVCEFGQMRKYMLSHLLHGLDVFLVSDRCLDLYLHAYVQQANCSSFLMILPVSVLSWSGRRQSGAWGGRGRQTHWSQFMRLMMLHSCCTGVCMHRNKSFTLKYAWKCSAVFMATGTTCKVKRGNLERGESSYME